jgi:hypothetical protein
MVTRCHSERRRSRKRVPIAETVSNWRQRLSGHPNCVEVIAELAHARGRVTGDVGTRRDPMIDAAGLTFATTAARHPKHCAPAEHMRPACARGRTASSDEAADRVQAREIRAW